MEELKLKPLTSNLKPNKKWGPISAVLVTIGSYLGSFILVIIFVSLIAVIVAGVGTAPETIQSYLEDSVVAQFSLNALVYLMSLWLIWLFVKSRKISFSELGLSKPQPKKLFYALPVFAVYFVTTLIAASLISALVPSINLDQEQQLPFDKSAEFAPIFLLLIFVSLVVIPALVEEIIVRGFLYSGLRKKLSIIASSLIASFIFAFAHLQLFAGATPLYAAAIDTFILSLFLIWLRQKTGNIWAGVVVHAIKNTLAFIALFILKVV